MRDNGYYLLVMKGNPRCQIAEWRECFWEITGNEEPFDDEDINFIKAYKIQSVIDSDGIDRLLAGCMNPPWMEFPDYTPLCVGFRMGGGEDYMDSWWKFWRGLTDYEKDIFKKNNPAPEGWDCYYK